MKRYFAFFTILAGLVLITLAGFMLVRPSILKDNGSGLPPSLAGLPLTNSKHGKQAVSELAQMHGTQFPLVDGWIGSFGSSRQATLWVAVSSDSASSDRLVNAMRNKIAMGNSPFTPVGERKEGYRSVYKLNGMGQKHFYFQSGKRLVWLAANEEIAEKTIQETLKFYP